MIKIAIIDKNGLVGGGGGEFVFSVNSVIYHMTSLLFSG